MAEVAAAVRRYHGATEQQAEVARRRQQLSATRDLLADSSEAEHAKRLAAELDAEEVVLLQTRLTDPGGDVRRAECGDGVGRMLAVGEREIGDVAEG